MAKIEIGPDGSPIPPRPTVIPDNPNPVSTKDFIPSKQEPVRVPGNPEQNPHTDGKENDVFSEPNVSVAATNVPPSMLPPSVPSTTRRTGIETVTPPNTLAPANTVPSTAVVGGPTNEPSVLGGQISGRPITDAELRLALRRGEVVADTANTPVPQFRRLSPEKQKEREDLMKKITDELREYGGESNIPYTSGYWSWQNQLRNL